MADAKVGGLAEPVANADPHAGYRELLKNKICPLPASIAIQLLTKLFNGYLEDERGDDEYVADLTITEALIADPIALKALIKWARHRNPHVEVCDELIFSKLTRHLEYYVCAANGGIDGHLPPTSHEVK